MGYSAITEEGGFWRKKLSSPDTIEVIEEAGYEGALLHTHQGDTGFFRDKMTVYATRDEARAAGWEVIHARNK
jgi:hypothetical protein